MSDTNSSSTDPFSYLITVNTQETQRIMRTAWRRHEGFSYTQTLRPIASSSSSSSSASSEELEPCFCGDDYATTPETYSPNDDDAHYAVRTACGHVFGLTCLQVWCLAYDQDNAYTCPNCRYALFADDLVGEARTRYHGRLAWFYGAAHRIGVDAIAKMQENVGELYAGAEIEEQLTGVHWRARMAFLKQFVAMVDLFEETGAALHWELWEKFKLMGELSFMFEDMAEKLEDEAGGEQQDPHRFFDLQEEAAFNRCLARAATGESERFGRAHNVELRRLRDRVVSNRGTNRHHQRGGSRFW